MLIIVYWYTGFDRELWFTRETVDSFDIRGLFPGISVDLFSRFPEKKNKNFPGILEI